MLIDEKKNLPILSDRDRVISSSFIIIYYTKDVKIGTLFSTQHYKGNTGFF